ncbi:hypothetical protein D3C71_1663000 [compost metagenome]
MPSILPMNSSLPFNGMEFSLNSVWLSFSLYKLLIIVCPQVSRNMISIEAA